MDYSLESKILQNELADLPNDYNDPLSHMQLIYQLHKVAVAAAQKIYSSTEIIANNLVDRGGCDKYWKIADQLNIDIEILRMKILNITMDQRYNFVEKTPDKNPSNLFISHFASSMHHLIWHFSRNSLYVFLIRVYTRQEYPEYNFVRDTTRTYFATIPTDILRYYIKPMLKSHVINHVLRTKIKPSVYNGIYNHPVPVLVHQTRIRHCECTDHANIYIVFDQHIETYCGIKIEYDTSGLIGNNNIISMDGYFVYATNVDTSNPQTNYIHETCIFTGQTTVISVANLQRDIQPISCIKDLVYITPSHYYANHISGCTRYQRINRNTDLPASPQYMQSNEIAYQVGNHFVSIDYISDADQLRFFTDVFIDGKHYMQIQSICTPVMVNNSMYILSKTGISILSFDFLVVQSQ